MEEGWSDRASDALEDRRLQLDAGLRLEDITQIFARQCHVSFGGHGKPPRSRSGSKRFV